MSPENDDLLAVVQPQQLVRVHQGSLGGCAALAVGPGIVVDRGEQRLHRRLARSCGDAGDTDLGRPVIHRHLVVGPQEDLEVTVADDLLPFPIGVAVGDLGHPLDHRLAVDVKAAAYSDGPLKIHQMPDVAGLLQHGVYRHRKAAAGAILPGVVGQDGEHQGEKHGTEKLQRTVLGGDDAVVGAGPLPQLQKVDVVVPGDLVDKGVLKDAEPVPQADGHIPPDLSPRQLKDIVGGDGRMPRRQLGEQFVDLLESVLRKDMVDRSQRPLLHGKQLPGGRLPAVVDIVEEGHEEVFLRLFPEVLALVGIGGVLDDDLGDGGDKGGVTPYHTHAVKTIAVFQVQEVVSFYQIPLPAQRLGGPLEKFSLGVHDDHTFFFLLHGHAVDKGQYKSPAFSGAGGSVDHHMAVKGQIWLYCQVFLLHTILLFAYKHSLQLLRWANVDKLFDLGSLGPPAPSTVGALSHNVKAPGVSLDLAAG